MNLESILICDDVVQSINDNMDYLLEVIPEIKYMMGFDHRHPHHHLDVWTHTLYAMSLSDNDFEIRLCLLLHDIGKPFSYQEGDVRHFKNHPLVSSVMARNILERFNYDNDFINEVCFLIKMHDSPICLNDIEDNYDLSLKRYEIQRCDALAHHPDKLDKRKKYLTKVLKMF